MGQIGRQKTASRPERARGDGQDGGRALATGIVPHEWPSGKCRARPPSAEASVCYLNRGQNIWHLCIQLATELKRVRHPCLLTKIKLGVQ